MYLCFSLSHLIQETGVRFLLLQYRVLCSLFLFCITLMRCRVIKWLMGYRFHIIHHNFQVQKFHHFTLYVFILFCGWNMMEMHKNIHFRHTEPFNALNHHNIEPEIEWKQKGKKIINEVSNMIKMRCFYVDGRIDESKWTSL